MVFAVPPSHPRSRTETTIPSRSYLNGVYSSFGTIVSQYFDDLVLVWQRQTPAVGNSQVGGGYALTADADIEPWVEP